MPPPLTGQPCEGSIRGVFNLPKHLLFDDYDQQAPAKPIIAGTLP